MVCAEDVATSTGGANERLVRELQRIHLLIQIAAVQQRRPGPVNGIYATSVLGLYI
jgi:hypothetical protein